MLSEEMRIRVLEEMIMQFVGHEMVHIVQELVEPEHMRSAVKLSAFAIKSQFLIAGSVGLSSLLFTASPDKITALLPVVAIASSVALEKSFNDKLSWVEKPAYQIQGKLSDIKFPDPVKYSVEIG